jgi:hypothetical protein
MGEILPFVLGCAFAGTIMALPRRVRPVLVPIGCVIGGAIASAVNGELSSGLWAVFVSFDALLVWIGAASTLSVVWLVRHVRTAG